MTFNADVTKLVPPKPSSSKRNIPDIKEGRGPTGIIATELCPTKDAVLLGVELVGGTIGNHVRIADFRDSRELLETRGI